MGGEKNHLTQKKEFVSFAWFAKENEKKTKNLDNCCFKYTLHVAIFFYPP